MAELNNSNQLENIAINNPENKANSSRIEAPYENKSSSTNIKIADETKIVPDVALPGSLPEKKDMGDSRDNLNRSFHDLNNPIALLQELEKKEIAPYNIAEELYKIISSQKK